MLFQICFLIFLHSSGSALPSTWKTCKRSSPDFNECIKNDIQTALVDLKDGNEELGISPIDPSSNHQAIIDMVPGFQMIMTNASMIGLTTNKIDQVSLDDWKSLNITMHAPSMGYNFTYGFVGKFLNFNINSTGDASVFLDDIYTSLNLTFSDYERDGKTYLKVEDLHIHYVPQSVRPNFVPHHQKSSFAKAMNKLLKENWKLLYSSSEKSGDKNLELIMKDIINHVFKSIPKEEIDLP